MLNPDPGWKQTCRKLCGSLPTAQQYDAVICKLMTSYLLTIYLSEKEGEAIKKNVLSTHLFLHKKERKEASRVYKVICPSHLVQPELIKMEESLCD